MRWSTGGRRPDGKGIALRQANTAKAGVEVLTGAMQPKKLEYRRGTPAQG